MARTTVAQIPAKLYELLEHLTPEDRSRVIGATLVLFGDEAQTLKPRDEARARLARTPGASNDPGAFFDEKDPQNKGEALAVAARYRELADKLDSHSKTELRAVITGASRNFDDANFARDMNNAKRQAGFFNLGTGRDTNKLSYYGKQYVDALPNREEAGKLKRPKIGGNKKPTAKKKTKAAK